MMFLLLLFVYLRVIWIVKNIQSFPITHVISTDKDWEDIKFGVDNQVDFYAVSFVKDAEVVHELKDYLRSKVLVPFSSVPQDLILNG